MPELRPIVHPTQSDTLVHFCGRTRASHAGVVAHFSPEERLTRIVTSLELRGFPPYGSSASVVCLSESDQRGVEALLRNFKFDGWGLVVQRQWAWGNGGGPVWYARSELWERIRGRLDDDARAFVVRTSPDDADWLHEREWRVPCPSGSLDLRDIDVVALIVSSSEWAPLVEGVWADDEGRLVPALETPALATAVPRWLWDGARVTELGPLPARVKLREDDPPSWELQ